MCGIFGYFAPSGFDPDPRLLEGAAVAAHRGPDGAGQRWFRLPGGPDGSLVHAEHWHADQKPQALLCHRRLAIIDLSDEALQPMSSDGGLNWIVFNGEIYNFIELRRELEALGARFTSHSDTEVILKAYEHWGMDAFARLVGMWAFALLDVRRQRIVLCRDRFGIKPLYFTEQGGSVAFASEIKQLLALPGARREANDAAIYDYLQYEGTDCGTESFFKGVRRLEPGTFRIYDLRSGDVSERSYYTPHANPPEVPATAGAAAEQFRALFKESVRIHLRSDVPVGTCLSGGLDSSAIAVLMREIALEAGLDVARHSFSCEFDIPEADERVFTAQAIKAAEVTPHYIQPREADLLSDLRRLVYHQDEPFGSTSIYAQWSVFRLVRESGVKVVLDGQGADEMMGGYSGLVPFFFLEQAAKGNALRVLQESWRWAKLQEKPWLAQLPFPQVQRLAALVSPKPAAAPAEPAWIQPDFVARENGQSSYLKDAAVRAFGANDHFGNVLHRFFFLANLPALLRYEDRNSMAFSVEARVPFLDHRLVDYVFALPSQFKFRGGYTKRVLRDAMDGTLPESLRMRARKMGFATPERLWQSGPLRPLIEAAIADPKLTPFIDRKHAEAHFARIRAGEAFSFAPWRWLNLSLWMQEFNVG